MLKLIWYEWKEEEARWLPHILRETCAPKRCIPVLGRHFRSSCFSSLLVRALEQSMPEF